MAIFTPLMRTHECNRPEENFQYYDDGDTMELFAAQTDVHVMLKPYIKALVEENSQTGMPVQRPLFMHYEDDTRAYDIQTEYLFGKDMLIAPVYLEGQTEWKVYLPEDEWVHLWTGKSFAGGDVTVEAPIGRIPAFYRKNSAYAPLFEAIRKKYGE